MDKYRYIRNSIALLVIVALAAITYLRSSYLYSENQTYSYSVRELSGKVNPAADPGFINLPAPYRVKESLYLRKETVAAFEKMAAAAEKDGIHLYVLSATRTFDAQKRIWESKYTGGRLVDGRNLQKEIPDEKDRALAILRYSSAPGTSRHHWGTDFDIAFSQQNLSSMLLNSTYETGMGKSVYEWLTANAKIFGFCQPYQDPPLQRNDKLHYGYEEEKWHWSYAPLSEKFLEAYRERQDELIPQGFEGANAVRDLYMDYVENIHASCR